MPLPQVLPAQNPDHVATLRAAYQEERQQLRRRQQYRVVRQPSGSPPVVAGIGSGYAAARALESESDPVMAPAAVLQPSAAPAGPIPVQATLAHLPARLAVLVVPAGAKGRAMFSQLPAVLAGRMSAMGMVMASLLPVVLTEPVPVKAMLPWLASQLRWPG